MLHFLELYRADTTSSGQQLTWKASYPCLDTPASCKDTGTWNSGTSEVTDRSPGTYQHF